MGSRKPFLGCPGATLLVRSHGSAPADLQGLAARARKLWMEPGEMKKIYPGTILLCLEQAGTVRCERALDAAVNPR